ncbi:MAG: 3-hydroxyacyl-CoA dehydrogenase family protein [Candidatus Glassbacteria bacterium]|nr:3-hydroxyacyl-CoA dehydrogenase family protein [Candidatus Glassbacteria bacterium]
MEQKSGKAIETVGLVGLGLMGQGIASCLVASGLRVIAYSRSAGRGAESEARIARALRELAARRIISRSRVSGWEERFTFVRSLQELAGCPFIVETVTEDLALKREIYDTLESVLPAGAVIASNTSSIPITLLQQGRKHPERFIGMHWAEPAEITRYLEVIKGGSTSARTVRLTRRLGLLCGKEPSVLNFDIRGFISNRLMYAMMREACHLVEIGLADVATVDRSFRNDIGWWAPFAGPFRWMDLTGIPLYAVIMEDLFPELCSDKSLPALMKEVVAGGAHGITNAKGFYKYTRKSAQEWEKVWEDFTYDIRGLVGKYGKRVKY